MSSAPAPELRIVVEQTAPIFADPSANAAAMARAVADANADVVVFPELALTGYALGHRARELGVALDDRPPFPLPPGPVAVYGLVERGEDHLTYNSAVAQRGDTLLAVHRKVYLPTYGTYDEGRIFAPGRRTVRPFPLAPGWKAGLLVCEDFWHPALAYLLALQEMDVLLVLAAGPGRDLTTGAGAPSFRSMESWELIARTTAMLHGIWVVLCNRAGVEDGVTFAGGSLVVAPSGSVTARAPHAQPAHLEATLALDAVARARQPFSHLRDDDAAVTLHTLDRIVRER